MQTKALVTKVASRGRQHYRHLRQHRQDRGSGTEAEEENQHRGVHQADVRATFSQESKAFRTGRGEYFA